MSGNARNVLLCASLSLVGCSGSNPQSAPENISYVRANVYAALQLSKDERTAILEDSRGGRHVVLAVCDARSRVLETTLDDAVSPNEQWAAFSVFTSRPNAKEAGDGFLEDVLVWLPQRLVVYPDQYSSALRLPQPYARQIAPTFDRGEAQTIVYESSNPREPSGRERTREALPARPRGKLSAGCVPPLHAALALPPNSHDPAFSDARFAPDLHSMSLIERSGKQVLAVRTCDAGTRLDRASLGDLLSPNGRWVAIDSVSGPSDPGLGDPRVDESWLVALSTGSVYSREAVANLVRAAKPEQIRGFAWIPAFPQRIAYDSDADGSPVRADLPDGPLPDSKLHCVPTSKT